MNKITLRRTEPADKLSDAFPWCLAFDRPGLMPFKVGVTQGELLDLWQQTGVTFNLAGMRDA